jgi:methionyl aminopeptidase
MIPIHTNEEFKKMHKAGKLAARLLLEIGNYIKPGLNCFDIDNFAKNFVEKHNVKSACLGYKGKGSIPFPSSVCISPNHVVCHGSGSEYVLKNGDIVSIDATLIVDGYFGDTCHTFAVGEISPEARNLINATKEARKRGIEAIKIDGNIGDIGFAIQNYIKTTKYSIVEEFCGHGLGTVFHQEPEVQHIGTKGSGPKIKKGMFFTVEPMINLGKRHIRILNDGWTVITKDYSLSAQFEHSIGVSENGVEIFTHLDELEEKY